LTVIFFPLLSFSLPWPSHFGTFPGLADDRFGLQILLQSEDPAFPTNSRLFEPAEGSKRIVAYCIDEDPAGGKFARHTVRAFRVGKPTLYKWWPTKATLVLAMLCERMAPKLEKPTVLTAEQSLRFRVRSLIDAFNGPFGKIVAGLIAEGQSEPAVLQEFFDRWVSPRRNATIADLQRGKDAGDLETDTEPELLNDAIFGAIYYRMLLRSGPLTRRFGEELVEQVILGHRSGNAHKS
jgi:hypothetical protein